MIGVYSLSLLALVAIRLGRNLTGFGDEPKLDGLARMATIRRIGRTELQKEIFRELHGHDGDLMITTALYESHFARPACKGTDTPLFTSGAASSDSDGDA
jgi:hypothetical protein